MANPSTTLQPTASESVGQSNVGRLLRQNIQTYTIIIALILIWGYFAIATKGGYASPQNISNLFRQMAVTSLMAAGMVLVIVTGNIDLSVGRLAGYVSVVVAYLQAYQWNKLFPDQPALAAVLSVIAGLLVGLIWGVGQGYIIAYLRVPAFIVTLGSYFILQGLVLLQTEGKTIPANQPVFSQIGQGYLPANLSWAFAVLVILVLIGLMIQNRRNKRKYGFPLPSILLEVLSVLFYSALLIIYVAVVNSYKVAPGIPYPVLLLGIVAVVITYVSNNTRFGRYTYAIGGNRDAARLSGISIQWNFFWFSSLVGFRGGLPGFVLPPYLGYGPIAAGAGYGLDVISSAILGGTSTLGGVGTIPGAMIGGLIVASLSTGLQMLNAPPATTYVIKGGVLVLAVLLDVYLKRNNS